MSDMQQYNILIVDEDEATRCTLADLLRGRDEYRVLVAGQGREAVKMFVEEARIDIVLTDIHMPGFNCLELMSDMQRLRHRPEILIMTSNGSPEVVEQARRIGARSIILKPFEHLDLIETEVEKAVQALFEARAATSCRMMSPPKAKPESAAASAPEPAGQPQLAPEPAAAASVPKATPAAGFPRPPEPGFLQDPPDAGLTMRIDRPDFAVPPAPPQAPPEPETMIPSPESARVGGNVRPAVMATAPVAAKPPIAATTPVAPTPAVAATATAAAAAKIPGTGAAPATAHRQDDHSSPPLTADIRNRGRVGLPDLGALKTRLFGKRTDLAGGHLARPFPDLEPSGGVATAPSAGAPAPSPARPPAPAGASRPVAVAPPPAVSAPPSSRPGPAQPPSRPAAQAGPAREEVAPGRSNLPPRNPAQTAPPAVAPPQAEEEDEPIILEVEMAEDVPAAGAHAEVEQDGEPIMLEEDAAGAIEAIIPAIEAATGPERKETAPAVATAGADIMEPEPAAEEPPTAASDPVATTAADPTESTAAASHPPEQLDAAAGNGDGEEAPGMPADLKSILDAGAEVDLGRMTLQIPIICLQTWEEQAALEALRPLAGARKRAFSTWSATRGIVKEDGTVMGEMYCDPIQALEFIRRQKANGLFVLIDFHNCLQDRKVVRMLREMFEAGETGRGMLVLTGPAIPIPPELQPACQLFEWPRGGVVDLDRVLEEVRGELAGAGREPIELDPEARRLLFDRVRGMPTGRARFEVLCALRGRQRSGG